ncbi:hypothetical protein ZWY2020_057694 [Hordeum vulgare]|nr:hypothetical protein ZWY2020_057694 [Hordeum vulgare]
MTSVADAVSAETSCSREPGRGPATSIGNQAMAATPSTDYVTPYGHQEACHAMGQIAYPTIDPYYGSLLSDLGGQPMMHPPMVGMHAAAIPLPTDAIEEPVYVNAKQYNAILRRRQSRAKAESERKLTKGRKDLHEPYTNVASANLLTVLILGHISTVAASTCLEKGQGAGGFLAKSGDNEEHSDSSSKISRMELSPQQWPTVFLSVSQRRNRPTRRKP